MARRVAISGIDKVLSNLNRSVTGIKNRSRQGIQVAALMVLGTSKKLTPVDTGNLRAGTYTKLLGGLNNPGAEIGYTAAYAVFVHERTELHHPVGQSKFLETALKQNAKKVLEIIRKTART